jgi:hypothetical protein
MLKRCVKTVESVWKSLVQTAGFYTFSTGSRFLDFFSLVFYPAKPTGPAHKNSLFTQPLHRISALLNFTLCPVSTVPMTTTNLIKE